MPKEAHGTSYHKMASSPRRCVALYSTQRTSSTLQRDQLTAGASLVDSRLGDDASQRAQLQVYGGDRSILRMSVCASLFRRSSRSHVRSVSLFASLAHAPHAKFFARGSNTAGRSSRSVSPNRFSRFNTTDRSVCRIGRISAPIFRYLPFSSSPSKTNSDRQTFSRHLNRRTVLFLFLYPTRGDSAHIDCRRLSNGSARDDG